MKKYRYGFALGGGGSRGLAHLGVLKALAEKGMKPDIIAGTSAGSIAGALMADGKTPDEIFSLLKDKGFFSYSSLRFPRRGFFSLEGLRDSLKTVLSAENIEDLQIPFYATVSNLNTGRVEYINKGNLVQAVVASSCIPVLFTPISINGYLYVDGGLVDNLPVAPIRSQCEYLIAVSLIPVNENNNIRGIKSIISRVAEMATNGNLTDEKNDADLIIEPPALANYEYLSVKKADEIFKTGYDYASQLSI